jgi:hypothetical protein
MPAIKSNLELTRPTQIQKLLSHTYGSSRGKRHPVALDTNKGNYLLEVEGVAYQSAKNFSDSLLVTSAL